MATLVRRDSMRVTRSVWQMCLRKAAGTRLKSTSSMIRVSEEVQQALAEGRPVVALETAVYTHGFPYPANVALSSLLESVVRTNGATPATIGVLDGIARVGLSAEELIRLAGSSGQPTTRKVSRRDFAYVCGLGSPGRRFNGGTTIAGTMVLAHLAGIQVFATGGLGGVHRGAETSLDISADLTELGRTPVAVISSGCKAFLDIPKTLEYLETQGVAVATFADGRQGDVDFPGFWSRDSGTKSVMTIQSEAEAAAMIDTQTRFGLQTGLCLANPIPEELSIPKAEIDEAIRQALEESAAAGVTGSANTPFVLNRIKEITGSRSVEVNRGLLAANAKRGALVAVELARLQTDARSGPMNPVMAGPGAANYSSLGLSQGISPIKRKVTGVSPARPGLPEVSPHERSTLAQAPSIFVAGSIAIDSACDYTPLSPQGSTAPMMQTSNPAEISQSIGGVGHNVARAIHSLGVSVRLCSVVGDDFSGMNARDALVHSDMDVAGLQVMPGGRTAQYVAVNSSDKALVVAMADMAILDQHDGSPGSEKTSIESTFENVWQPQLTAARPRYVVVDGNWSADMLGRWLQAGQTVSAITAFEPVSTAKSTRLFHIPGERGLTTYPNVRVGFATPNDHELVAMHQAAQAAGFFDRQDWWQVIDALGIPSTGARTQLALGTSPELVDRGIPQQSIQLLPFIPRLLTKLGSEGVLLTQIIPAGDPRLSDGKYAPYILSRCNNGTEDTTKVGGLYMRLFPAERVPEEEIVSVNGVGDTFLGAIIAGLARDGSRRIEELVPLAQRAAVMTLRSKESVAPGLANLSLAGL